MHKNDYTYVVYIICFMKMKDIIISLLILLIVIMIRGSYVSNSEVDRVPYYSLDFDSMEERIHPDEEIFMQAYL